eukprot:COSAG01_NODE_4270_length_5189_cov_2.508242_2_plen_88_part_00
MLCLIFFVFFFPSESVWAAAPPGVPLLWPCCLPAAEDNFMIRTVAVTEIPYVSHFVLGSYHDAWRWCRSAASSQICRSTATFRRSGR